MPAVLCVGPYPTAGPARDCRTEVCARPVLRFWFPRRRPPLLQSPPPHPSAALSARSWSFASQPADPIERALFCRLSSQAYFVEWLASAPSLRLTPPWVTALSSWATRLSLSPTLRQLAFLGPLDPAALQLCGILFVQFNLRPPDSHVAHNECICTDPHNLIG